MKKITVIFPLIVVLLCIVTGCHTAKKHFDQSRVSQPYFDSRTRYGNDVPRVDTFLKDVPIVNAIKTNAGFDVFQIDMISEKKYLTDSLRRVIKKLFKSNEYKATKKFGYIAFENGTYIVVPVDNKKDRRIFIAKSPYYYFTVQGEIILFRFYRDKNGNVPGWKGDLNNEKSFVPIIKDLVSGK